MSVVLAFEGAAELHGAEAKLVAEQVGGFGELFKFLALLGGEQFKLLRVMRDAGEGNSGGKR